MARSRPMSAQRRARLRRTVLGLVLLVTASGAGAHALWDDDAAPAAAHTAPSKTADGQAPHTSPTPARTTPGTRAQAVGSAGFAPVVTDRIPEPTTSIALSAPVPGTTNMQPSAAAAFTAAFAAAEDAGLSPQIKSAWRSERYQQVLFDRAVTRYGSRAEAAKWVLPPLSSAHVKGYAVDVRPENVAAWLEVNGARFGVCRTYDNEWWHFEYVASSSCPARKPDAAG